MLPDDNTPTDDRPMTTDQPRRNSVEALGRWYQVLRFGTYQGCLFRPVEIGSVIGAIASLIARETCTLRTVNG